MLNFGFIKMSFSEPILRFIPLHEFYRAHCICNTWTAIFFFSSLNIARSWCAMLINSGFWNASATTRVLLIYVSSLHIALTTLVLSSSHNSFWLISWLYTCEFSVGHISDGIALYLSTWPVNVFISLEYSIAVIYFPQINFSCRYSFWGFCRRITVQ